MRKKLAKKNPRRHSAVANLPPFHLKATRISEQGPPPLILDVYSTRKRPESSSYHVADVGNAREERQETRTDGAFPPA